LFERRDAAVSGRNSNRQATKSSWQNGNHVRWHLTGNSMSGNLFHRAGAVAPLTRLAGRFSVKNPMENLAGLTWTARDVGGPGVEAFGMTCLGVALAKTDK
jgi:hypothetical protein